MVTSRRREAPLTRDELFERALAIADAEGLGALTMRRLAQEVGVEAASLYHHVPNKEALIDGMLTKMRAEVQVAEPVPEDWKELMLAIFAAYREVLEAHPNLISLAGRRVEEGDAESNGLLFLKRVGLNDEDAVQLWQSLLALAVGFSMFSSEYARSDVGDLPPALASRASEWRDETCSRAMKTILESYDRNA